MKRILLVGKINDAVKGIEEVLGACFHVQICPLHVESFKDILKVVKPDLILISLVGAYDDQSVVFNILKTTYSEIPVITIGTEFEKKSFLDYYDSPQFENLIRPVDNKIIMDAVCNRLQCTYKIKDGVYEVIEKRERKLVLVVDDNAAALRSIKDMLQDNYEVSVANSGMKALTQMGKKRPDLILLDYEMPVCDGRQTLEMIRADEDFKDIPVIFLTGVSDRAHIEAVLDLKPAGYMLKPAVREKLLAAIEEKTAE